MSKIKKQLLAGPYLIWIIGFIILPLFMIMYYAFKSSDGGFTFEYVAAIAQHTNIKALLLSLRLGIICTIICLVLSYPLAMILNGLKIKNQSFVVFVFMLPMWMNFMLRILAWKQLLSKNGVINSILTTLGLPGFNIMNTSGAVVLGMVYDFLPFMLLPIYNSMTRIKNDWIEAALDLGGFRAITHILCHLTDTRWRQGPAHRKYHRTGFRPWLAVGRRKRSLTRAHGIRINQHGTRQSV